MLHNGPLRRTQTRCRPRPFTLPPEGPFYRFEINFSLRPGFLMNWLHRAVSRAPLQPKSDITPRRKRGRASLRVILLRAIAISVILPPKFFASIRRVSDIEASIWPSGNPCRRCCREKDAKVRQAASLSTAQNARSFGSAGECCTSARCDCAVLRTPPLARAYYQEKPGLYLMAREKSGKRGGTCDVIMDGVA
jgi:hypothetical protein